MVGDSDGVLLAGVDACNGFDGEILVGTGEKSVKVGMEAGAAGSEGTIGHHDNPKCLRHADNLERRRIVEKWGFFSISLEQGLRQLRRGCGRIILVRAESENRFNSQPLLKFGDQFFKLGLTIEGPLSAIPA